MHFAVEPFAIRTRLILAGPIQTALQAVSVKGAHLRIGNKNATGQPLLSRYKALLPAVPASLLVLATLFSPAEAFFFDWPWSGLGQPNVSRHPGTTPRRTPQTHPPANAVTSPEKAVTGDKPAVNEKPAAKEQPADLTAKAKGVLLIAVSLNRQQLTLYSDGLAIARTHVSTGPQTPTGVFSIIQKDRLHRSDAYGEVPLYQQITWSGMGLHQALGPGRPAPPAGIRLPEELARQLWGITKPGVRVIVTNGEITPVPIAHAGLFTRSPEPLQAGPQAGPTSAKVTEPSDGAAPASGAGRQRSGPAPLDAMAYALTKPAEHASSSEVVRSAYDSFDLSKARRTKALPRSGAAGETYRPGPISMFISRKEGKLFVRKGFEPLFNAAVTIAQPEKPLGTHVFTAVELNDDDSMRWNVVTLPAGWTRPGRRSSSDEQPSIGKPSSPAEALDRVRLATDVHNRISDLMSTGASLIISDEALGRETGPGTDFTVLTR
jgi:lipoprotein-anchoring transpeptidase ErfK/SrfK